VSVHEQSAPRVALRFDVDTFQCMHQGVPRLLELAKHYEVPITFFVNMGRAVSYREILRKLGQRRYPDDIAPGTTPKISPVKKIGLRGILYTLLANPRVGLSSRLLTEIESRGHEIGLHGGRNHATWQNNAHAWTTERLNKELHWGLAAMKNAGVGPPRSFASPGWNSPNALPALLMQNDFTVIADCNGIDHNGRDGGQSITRLRSINTNLVGQPGGVGYLESCAARQLTFKDMAAEARQALDRFTDVVIYDHPAYAAGLGFARLQTLIEALQDHNGQFLTIEQMASQITDEPQRKHDP
jgi:peptidoglycan/xylan/chitin deacetylase (PgdA/CDA1 family)